MVITGPWRFATPPPSHRDRKVDGPAVTSRFVGCPLSVTPQVRAKRQLSVDSCRRSAPAEASLGYRELTGMQERLGVKSN
jgi:hypothetical protein